MTDKILIDRATLEQMVVGLQRMSSACELEGDNHRNGDKWYRLCDDADKALTAGRAALANAERVESDAQLCKFYDVATYPDLVAAMEKHITKLQVRTPPLTGEAFTQKSRFA